MCFNNYLILFIQLFNSSSFSLSSDFKIDSLPNPSFKGTLIIIICTIKLYLAICVKFKVTSDSYSYKFNTTINLHMFQHSTHTDHSILPHTHIHTHACTHTHIVNEWSFNIVGDSVSQTPRHNQPCFQSK